MDEKKYNELYKDVLDVDIVDDLIFITIKRNVNLFCNRMKPISLHLIRTKILNPRVLLIDDFQKYDFFTAEI